MITHVTLASVQASDKGPDGDTGDSWDDPDPATVAEAA